MSDYGILISTNEPRWKGKVTRVQFSFVKHTLSDSVFMTVFMISYEQGIIILHHSSQVSISKKILTCLPKMRSLYIVFKQFVIGLWGEKKIKHHNSL